jgi:hypothetical protein
MICPTDGLKLELQAHLSEFDMDVNVYMVDSNIDVKWLLSVTKFADVVIFDIDNSPNEVQDLRSYLISLSNVFWLTNREFPCYTLLSTNREYNLDFLYNKLGGYIEKKTRTS